MEEKNKKIHQHCDCHDHDCDCNHEHHHNHEDCDNIDDYICDIDPSKICDNCMQCLNTFNTDGKGYVSIGIDGVDPDTGMTLEDLYKMYGLDDDE